MALTSTYGAGRLLIVELPLRNGAIGMDCALGRAERRLQGSADCSHSSRELHRAKHSSQLCVANRIIT
jgi:hypothetical protein